jgi:hypothetical protein
MKILGTIASFFILMTSWAPSAFTADAPRNGNNSRLPQRTPTIYKGGPETQGNQTPYCGSNYKVLEPNDENEAWASVFLNLCMTLVINGVTINTSNGYKAVTHNYRICEPDNDFQLKSPEMDTENVCGSEMSAILFYRGVYSSLVDFHPLYCCGDL